MLKATQFLFQLLDETNETADFTELKKLYLPCIDGKLYPSDTLVFSFCTSDQELEALQKNFHFLEDLSRFLSYDKYKQWRLLGLLPKALRPENLSNITQEQLEESSLKLCHYGEHCESRNSLKELLISHEFQWAFVALLKWQDPANPVEIEDIQYIWDKHFSQEQLEVVCYEKVCTIKVHNSQPLEGTQCAKLAHAMMLPDDRCQFYLEHQERLERSKVVHFADILAKEVNRLLGERLQSEAVTVLMKILVCQEPQEIAEVLKDNKVPLHQPAHRSAWNLPPAGEEIPEEWYDSLEMNIIHTFVPGDYVGYLDSSQLKEHYLYAVVLEALGLQQSGGGHIPMYHVDLGGGRKANVSTYDLYHFRRNKQVSDLNKSLVLVENCPSGGSTASPAADSIWYQHPLSEVKKEVDACLAEIWCLSVEERKKAVRRLYLCYHPDKNVGQEELANEIFKYLKERIQEMENKDKPSGSNSNTRNFWNFSQCWSEWNEQAHRHHHSRERGYYNYDFWSFHQSRPNCSRNQSRRLCEEEAKRWLRQAECDLKAAAGVAGDGSTEWLLYMTYQAVEKALTAVVYSEGGHFDKSQSLAMLASTVASWGDELKLLPEQIDELRDHGVDDKTTQYPSYHDLPTIPNEAFQACKEKDVLLSARKILNTVKKWLGQ
uniref:HEPN domain-containing protein n=1 Tax=Anolis carolinensis TaxID=28377 RepID=A0A803TLC6_ANOCA